MNGPPSPNVIRGHSDENRSERPLLENGFKDSLAPSTFGVFSDGFGRARESGNFGSAPKSAVRGLRTPKRFIESLFWIFAAWLRGVYGACNTKTPKVHLRTFGIFAVDGGEPREFDFSAVHLENGMNRRSLW